MSPLTVLQFDMRAAPFCPDTSSQRYSACIEMVKWADEQNISVVGFSEHHNAPDGFISAPLMMAMSAATASRRLTIAVSALQLPLHDPIRVAEDLAVLDLVSNGRFVLTLGLGYRELEYQTFGISWANRGRILDEKLAVLLQALSGEEFEYQGARVRLNPVPARDPRSFLMVGGNSPAAARRAARFKLLFAPAIDDLALQSVYDKECQKHGFDRGAVVFPREPSLTLIAEDPDKAWAQVGQFLLYDAVSYAGWKHNSRKAYAESAATSLEDLRAEGKYAILTPGEAVKKMVQKGSINLAPLCGGVPIEFGWTSLKLFAEEVVPAYSTQIQQ